MSAAPGTAPALQLGWARLGTAAFARALAALTDDGLREPSLLPGWTRGQVVAHVGYNARALSRLVDWARTGVETPMYASTEQRDREIAEAVSLPGRAIRDLFAHSAAHLDAAWRDVTEDEWTHQVRTAQGRTVPLSETGWMRTREVWVHAVDLGTDGAGHEATSYDDFPADLLDALTTDVVNAWARRQETVDLVLAPTDRAGTVRVGADDHAPVVSGTSADLVRWLTGRGARHLSVDGTPVDGTPLDHSNDGATLPTLPRWL